MQRMLLPLLPVLLIAASCSNTPPPPVSGRLDPYGSQQIEFRDADLSNETAVGQPVLNRDPSNLLHVQVPIRSTIDKDLHIQYRATFFDQNGQVIETSDWQDKILTANTSDSVGVTCVSPAAVNFQMDFRYARMD